MRIGPVTHPGGYGGNPVEALRRIAFLLERLGEPAHRARAFRRAARAIDALPPEEVRRRAAAESLTELTDVGPVTAAVAEQALDRRVPEYLERLEARLASQELPGGPLFAALRGDCHVHSDWSDGTASIREMAKAAIEIGHDYIVLTDHSPSLTIARGLSRGRLRQQLEVVERLNAELAPFRILTGIEVDIMPDGTLDQEPELLERLDVVVGSVHSQLRMEREPMTERMLAAIANPHLDVLGHCTGRRRFSNRTRPESQFDSERVFEACERSGKAIEINSQQERRDPPRRLIRRAVQAGCVFVVDSDAHWPGALMVKVDGCERAASEGVTEDRVMNTLPAEELLEWTRSHDATPARGVSR